MSHFNKIVIQKLDTSPSSSTPARNSDLGSAGLFSAAIDRLETVQEVDELKVWDKSRM